MTATKVVPADQNPLGVPAHQHINPDGSIGGWVVTDADSDQLDSFDAFALETEAWLAAYTTARQLRSAS